MGNHFWEQRSDPCVWSANCCCEDTDQSYHTSWNVLWPECFMSWHSAFLKSCWEATVVLTGWEATGDDKALLITVTLWERVVSEELKSTSSLWDVLPSASATKERHNTPASSSQRFPISSVFIWFTASHKTKRYAILGKVVCWCVAKGREIWVFYACCSYLWNHCHLTRSH